MGNPWKTKGKPTGQWWEIDDLMDLLPSIGGSYWCLKRKQLQDWSTSGLLGDERQRWQYLHTLIYGSFMWGMNRWLWTTQKGDGTKSKRMQSTRIFNSFLPGQSTVNACSRLVCKLVMMPFYGLGLECVNIWEFLRWSALVCALGIMPWCQVMIQWVSWAFWPFLYRSSTVCENLAQSAPLSSSTLWSHDALWSTLQVAAFWRASTQARVHTGSVRPLQGHCPRTHMWCRCHPRSISCDIYTLGFVNLSENKVPPMTGHKMSYTHNYWTTPPGMAIKIEQKGVQSQFWHQAHCPMAKRQKLQEQLCSLLTEWPSWPSSNKLAADGFVSKCCFIHSSQCYWGKWGLNGC